MADCPNCGLRTQRTKDWACQWCGYPLLSRAYKVIDKTFKELQEERKLAAQSTGAENELELEPEYEPEPEPEPEPKPKPRTRPPVKPVYTIRHEPVPSPQPTPAPQEVLTQTPPEPPVVQPAPEPVQPLITPPPPPPQNEVVPESAPMITPPPADAVPPPAPEPEILIEPEPIPEPTIALEDIQDGMEITAEQIDALFKAEKDEANAGLTGKTLVIKGIVEKVFVREHLDIRYIMVTGARKGMTWSLRCTFNKEESSKLTRLQEGQAILVQGKYDGYSKNIIFKDCVLV